MYRDIPEELRVLIEPVVTDHGLELVDVELARGRAPWRVSITVDTPAGDGRVSVERCAAVSREVGTQLDAADAIPVPYRLQVSSPGLDRVLGREKDFEAARGCEVRLETREPVAGQRRFRGRLVAFDGASVRLRGEQGEWEIPFDRIVRARRVYEFTSDDFGRGGRRSRHSSGPGVERR